MNRTQLKSALVSGGHVLRVIWPFLLGMLLLAGLSVLRGDISSAARAYVGGESLWSKGQKDAYFYINRYTQTSAESDYQAYLSAIAVPLGDRTAREELEKATPDYEAVRRGFLIGGNAAADVPGMIWLFRNFQNVDGFAQALDIWREADKGIAELQAHAQALHEQASSGPDAERRHSHEAEITRINLRLAPMEVAFSSTLGEASRRIEHLLNIGLLAITAIMVALGVLLSRRALRQRDEADAALRISEERYALAVDGANDGIWDFDAIKRKVFYSQRVRDMLGYDESVLGADPADLERIILPEDYPAARAAVYSHWAERTGSVLRYRMRMRTSSGKVLWILARSTALYAPDGAPVRMAGSYTDITEQVEMELQLRLAASVFESSHQGIVIVDGEQNIVSANRAFIELSGYSVDELIGRSIVDLRPQAIDADTYSKIWQTVQREGSWRGESLGCHKSGENHPAEVSIVQVPDPSGKAVFYIYTCTDISERQYAAARIHHLAYFDVLTGLPNRSYMGVHFDKMIVAARAAKRKLAVVFFDLDGFKEVNDALGHTAGDKVIAEQAQRLRSGVSESDVLCRFGGDEFLLLLMGCDCHQAEQVARRLIASLAQPLTLEGREVTITASAGVSVFPTDAIDTETLIRAADTALYRAKAQGKNIVVLFKADMDKAVARRFELLSGLRMALDREQFELRFQPILDTINLGIVGVEALVYWNHPTQGTIAPGTFIGLAEESGLIESLGAWVIEESISEYTKWIDVGLSPIYLSINLSTQQLRQPQVFQERLDAALKKSRLIKPSQVMLEITERQIVHDLSSTLPVLADLTARRIGLAIDDFGTGYSSLAYLKSLPVTQIKIDLSFIRNLTSDAGDRVIVKAIIDLGRSLRLDVVAEGVETIEQLALLREYACPKVQGFLFAKPLTSTDFLNFSMSHRSTMPAKIRELQLTKPIALQ